MSAPDNLKAVASLEPAAVWRYFAGMAGVPRPSKSEERIREHIRNVAKQAGLSARQDDVGNIVIDVPASPGCEKAPVTVLQGHLDMVGDKNADKKHDFENDPITLILEKDKKSGEPILRADNTTLGADNGVGVSMALAAATEKDVKHGPLELLFTTDEEAGMTGAKALSPKSFKGRRLINLDSEEDDAIYIGCAGGCDVTLEWTCDLAPIDAAMKVCRVDVSGLRGGHSGGDIHENRASANKVIARVLRTAGVPGIRLAHIEGGNKRNAIARESHAVVAVAAEHVDALKKAAADVQKNVAHESAEKDAKIAITAADGGKQKTALSAADSRRVLAALQALPHGVLEMHPKIRDLVQTSNNVSTIESEAIDGGKRMRITVGLLARSSVETRKFVVADQIGAVGDLAGAKTFVGNDYPGWEPDVDSKLLAVTRRKYADCFGHEPKVLAIHAGLECGIIGQLVGNMDMVSFGPHITGAHSPDEQIFVNSVPKSWNLLKAVLAELAKG